MTEEEPIIKVENLTKHFDASEGFLDSLVGRSQWVKAVDGVDLELYEGETLGVVGESGCGKTTLGRTLLRLIEPTDGTVYYRGEDITEASSRRLRDLRRELQYIFQDPYSSLNPRLTVGDIIGEPLDIHELAEGQERTDRIYELLETVDLNPSHAHRYPHEFSGGQRQRIGIARALAVEPDVIVADEPVSALDVSVQAQILNLLEDLQDDFGLTYIFIAHDLSVVEHISDRVGVMYLGEFVEMGETEEVFGPPHHPYAEALLSAIPEPDPLWEGDRILLSGNVPSPINPPSGCRFHTRCPRVIQPADYDLEQAEWRSLMDMKERLENAGHLDAIVAVAEREETAKEEFDPESVDRGTFGEMVRAEFDLPAPLTDPQAEAAFSDCLDTLHTGAVESGLQELQEAFESPCERTHPELVSADDSDHRIACLLFEDEYVDLRPSFDPRSTGLAGADD